ncbi:putative 3-methyladenine DNA glycosylase [subsurface metagenome]
MLKLSKTFYQEPAREIAKDFLGKYLVFNSPEGKISGKIIDVEAYPAFLDDVSHGNKRTKRTEIMYKEGGYAYVYVIYGVHYQFAVVVNKKGIPDVIFIRAVVPDEGIDIMKKNFGKLIKKVTDLTKSPGNLCKSFGVDMKLYGADLTGDTIFIEDKGIKINPEEILSDRRVGINQKIGGSENKFRFFIKS